MATSSPSAKYTAEFVGTFFLIFTVGCNVLGKNGVWGGVSIGSVLMVAIYALGGVSGANFNPAVSLSLGLTKAMGGPGMEFEDVATYMVVQVAAAVMVAFSFGGLWSKSFDVGPADNFGAWEAGLAEFLYTFMLCFVVLNVAAAKSNTPNQFYGLAIGYVIVAGAYGAGAVSGGCFNPAVAIGLGVSSRANGFGWCVFYTLCEFAGAALAAGLFRVVRPQEFEAENGKRSILVSEFLGTFMLVLTVGLNVLGKSAAGAFSIAASLMCMIYALGNVSGGHFNPAVTVAVLCSGRCPELTLATAWQYMGAQIVGGLAAGLIYPAMRGGSSFPLGPGDGFGWAEVAAAESVFTFLLCFTVLCVAVSKVTNSSNMFGLAIGACVTVGGNAIGGISGGSLNPAVSFGISCSHMVYGGGGTIVAALLYTLFEVLGAGLAARVFQVTHAVDTHGEDTVGIKNQEGGKAEGGDAEAPPEKENADTVPVDEERAEAAPSTPVAVAESPAEKKRRETLDKCMSLQLIYGRGPSVRGPPLA